MSTKILRVFWSVVACPLLLLVSALPAFARGCDALDDGTHCYVTAQQVPPTRPHGVGGLFTEPDDLVVSPPDYSIAQLILVDAADSGKSIEFGWVVDPKRYNNATPHLFIALRHWHKIGTAFSSVRCVLGNPDPTPACVNNKYVPLFKTTQPGSTVGITGRPMMYHVGYYAGDACDGETGWWIQYGDEWIRRYLLHIRW